MDLLKLGIMVLTFLSLKAGKEYWEGSFKGRMPPEGYSDVNRSGEN